MDNENEIWKDIPDYEGYYQVSNMGRVRSVDREVRHWKGGLSIMKGKVLKPAMDRKGYLLVALCKEGKHKSFRIHRLVYAAFCGTIPDGYDVNHINECKTNNRLENLNLMTPMENCNFGTRNLRVAKTLTNHPLRSKPVVALDNSGNVVLEFLSASEAGRQGFHQGALSACCIGKQKTHRGYRWRYKADIENA